jgi:P pilus assembly chaperone PapD
MTTTKWVLGFLAISLVAAAPAKADLVLSQLIVELQPGANSRQDVEVWNSSPDRAYVAVEPAEIVDPGQASQQRRTDPDPEKLGLLVSPARMILEPGQRKLVRVADLLPPSDRERVYRITVKPEVGAIASATSGLKVLVGYDVLVLVRPVDPRPNVSFTRAGDTATFRNSGNASVELIDGRQCDAGGKSCSDLPGKRLYSGAEWSEPLKPGYHAEYTLKSLGQMLKKSF